MNDAPAVASTPSEPKGPGFFDTLIGLYTAPVATFRTVATRPSFVAPLAGAILLNLVFTFVWTRKVDPVEFMRAKMEESGQLDRFPAEQQADILQRQARMFPVFAWLGPVLFVPAGMLVIAALYLFVFRFFYSSETTFAQSLAVVAWTFLAVGLVTTPLTLLVMSLKGEWSIDPRTVLQANPAALVDRAAVPKPVYALLDAFDLFSAWILFLLSAGYAAAARRPLGSAAAGVLALWGIYELLKVALAAVF